jgi:hypothetical protein
VDIPKASFSDGIILRTTAGAFLLRSLYFLHNGGKPFIVDDILLYVSIAITEAIAKQITCHSSRRDFGEEGFRVL